MKRPLDIRQSVLRTPLNMVGSAAGASVDSILINVDPEISKLYEDRNMLLVDGGIVNYSTAGNTVNFTEPLLLQINSKVSGGSPTIINLGSVGRTISADGRMIYAVINRTLGTAVVTDDAATLPAVNSINQEVVLIAKRSDSADGTKRLYFRDGSSLSAGASGRLGNGGGGTVLDSEFSIAHTTDTTRRINFDVEGASGTTTTIQSTSSVNHILTLPDITDVLVSRSNTEKLSNKQIAFSVATDSVTTGSNAALSAFSTGIVRLGNGSLASISGMPPGSSDGLEVILENVTGNTISLINNGTAAAPAITNNTGTPQNLTNSVMWTGTADQWQSSVFNISGSGSYTLNNVHLQLSNSGTGASVASNNGTPQTFSSSSTWLGSFDQWQSSPFNIAGGGTFVLNDVHLQLSKQAGTSAAIADNTGGIEQGGQSHMNGNNALAMPFPVLGSGTFTLNSVDLRIGYDQNSGIPPSGNMFVQIWNTSGGVPTSQFAGSISNPVNPSSLAFLPASPFVTFTFTSPVVLSAGTTYAVVLYGTGFTGGSVSPTWWGATPHFSGGYYNLSGISGGSWVSTHDFQVTFSGTASPGPNPTGNLVAKVYNTSGGVPTTLVAGAVSNSFNISALTSSNSEQTFTFSSPPILNSGTEYAIVLDPSGVTYPTGSDVLFWYSNTGTQPNSQINDNNGSPGSWTDSGHKAWTIFNGVPGGSVSGNLIARVYNASGGLPTTPIVGAVSNTLDVTTLTTSNSEQIFTFSSPPVLTAGSQYAIVLDPSGVSFPAGSNVFFWYSATGLQPDSQYNDNGGLAGSWVDSGSIAWSIFNGVPASALVPILTGSGGNLDMQNNSSATLIYDASTANWRVIDTPVNQVIAPGFNVADKADNTKQVAFSVSSSTSGVKSVLAFASSANRQYNFPNATTTLVGTDVFQTLSNKTLLDSSTIISNTSDTSKQLKFSGSGATTGTSTTLAFSQTGNRVITFPDETATLITPDSSNTLTNKILQYLQTTSSDNTTQTGTNQTLNAFTTGIVRITNAGFTGVSGIPAGASGQHVTIENQTGAAITVQNQNGSASPANQIMTGTGADVAMSANSSFDFLYDASISKWMLVGGAGSGGSSGGVQPFTSSGSFLVPAGVSRLMILAVGGGGGGGGGGSQNGDIAGCGGGAGGQGGATQFITFPCTPGETLTVTVGFAGAGGLRGRDNPSPFSYGNNGGDGNTGGSTVITGSLATIITTGGSGGQGGKGTNTTPKPRPGGSSPGNFYTEYGGEVGGGSGGAGANYPSSFSTGQAPNGNVSKWAQSGGIGGTNYNPGQPGFGLGGGGGGGASSWGPGANGGHGSSDVNHGAQNGFNASPNTGGGGGGGGGAGDLAVDGGGQQADGAGGNGGTGYVLITW